MAPAPPREMSFWDHIDELRRRLVVMLVAVGGFTIFFFTFRLQPATLGGVNIWVPVPTLTDTVSSAAVRQMVADLVPRVPAIPQNVTLVVTGPFDAVMVTLQVSFFLGLVFAMPVVVYQLVRFVAPALRPRERRALLRWVAPAALLFAAGNLFAYYAILPFAIAFLYAYAFPLGATALLHLSDLMGIVTFFSIAFGLVFELPVLMVGLTRSGLISAGFWSRNWRMATLGIFVFSAVITPDGTGVTMMLVALPMMALYGAGALLARRTERRMDSRWRKGL